LEDEKCLRKISEGFLETLENLHHLDSLYKAFNHRIDKDVEPSI